MPRNKAEWVRSVVTSCGGNDPSFLQLPIYQLLAAAASAPKDLFQKEPASGASGSLANRYDPKSFPLTARVCH
jgi:hypothetical protein